MDWDQIAEGLETQGLVVLESFLSAEEVNALARESRHLQERQQFRAAGMGKKQAEWKQPSIRGDSILWWEHHTLSPAQRTLWSRWDELRREVNQRLFLGLTRLEAHYAVYPEGAGYARHQDRFQTDDARVLSVVCYLNESWVPEHGGELLVYADTKASTPHHTILPRGGTTVLFLSDLPHEVLPARHERRSVAGWFKRNASLPL